MADKDACSSKATDREGLQGSFDLHNVSSGAVDQHNLAATAHSSGTFCSYATILHRTASFDFERTATNDPVQHLSSASLPPPSKRRRKDQSKDESDDPSAAPSSTPDILSPVVVFAHGAGAHSSSDWMIKWKDMSGKCIKRGVHAGDTRGWK
ncbi:hypothetical protein ACFX2B_012367 [Malus domestica]